MYNFSMKILLISPYYLSKFDYPEIYPPINLAYIAAAVRASGAGIPKIIDLALLGKIREGEFWRYGCSDDEIARIIRDESPDVIGVPSIFSTRFLSSGGSTPRDAAGGSSA